MLPISNKFVSKYHQEIFKTLIMVRNPCVPSVAHLWAHLHSLIHSLLHYLITQRLRLTSHKLKITVNVKCHCQWNPANQLLRAGKVGRSWCKKQQWGGFDPGLNGEPLKHELANLLEPQNSGSQLSGPLLRHDSWFLFMFFFVFLEIIYIDCTKMAST